MKKLVCLLAVIALAASASAAVDVISSGVFQNIWAGGTNEQGYSGTGHFTESVAAPGGKTAVEYDGTGKGWLSMPINLAGDGNIDISGNRYLEYDVYYANDRTADYSECMNLDHSGTDYQFQAQLALTIDDGTTTAYNLPYDYRDPDPIQPPIMTGGNKWVHIKLDLLENTWGTMGAPLVIDSVGVLRFGAHNHTDGGYNTDMHIYIADMAFTPEPATIALLGLGGLALIRRKR